MECRVCGQPAMEGKVYCTKHIQGRDKTKGKSQKANQSYRKTLTRKQRDEKKKGANY